MYMHVHSNTPSAHLCNTKLFSLDRLYLFGAHVKASNYNNTQKEHGVPLNGELTNESIQQIQWYVSRQGVPGYVHLHTWLYGSVVSVWERDQWLCYLTILLISSVWPKSWCICSVVIAPRAHACSGVKRLLCQFVSLSVCEFVLQ